MSSTPIENDPSQVAASSSWYSGGTSRSFAILRTREFGTGVVAGLGAMFLLGMNGPDAVQFGAIASLGNSMGDAGAKFGNLRTNMAGYDYGSTYIDLYDVATATGASALLFWYLGASGNQLLMSAGIAGVSAGVGPKIMTFVGDKVGSQ